MFIQDSGLFCIYCSLGLIILIEQWFLTFISLPNPYVILLWFEKIFLIFHSLGPFLFKLLDFVLVFIFDLFFFFVVFDILLLLFDLFFLIRAAPAKGREL